jgi:uncharacterized alkaline shock family protein YloU
MYYYGDIMTEGKTTIAPEVLNTLARLTTLSVEGVSRLSTTSTKFSRIFKRGYNEGVEINIHDDSVYIDIFVVLKNDVNIRKVSHNIQQNVSRAIEETVGMPIGAINIHIEDVDFLIEAED